MSIYYSKEIDVKLVDSGNKVIAVMHWFGNENEEWEEVVEINDIRMMNEKEIEEKIKEELKKIVIKEFDTDKLIFKWKLGK